MAPKARPRRDTSLKARVAQAIKDNFKGWADADIYSNEVEGLTLYQRLLEAKSRQQDDPTSQKAGRLFYAELKDMYAPEESLHKQISIKDPSLSINPRLFDAMCKCKKVPPIRGAMVQYLSSAPHAEPVGVRRYLQMGRRVSPIHFCRAVSLWHRCHAVRRAPWLERGLSR